MPTAGSILDDTCPDPRVALTHILGTYESVETSADVHQLAYLGAKACEVAPSVFSTASVCHAIVRLLSKSSSVETTRWLASWVCSATFRHKEARAVFATGAMRDALALALTTATTSDEVRYVCSAVCSVTAGLADARRIFGDCDTMLDALCNGATRVEDADACRWWLCAVCNIVANDDDNERRFGTHKSFINVMCATLPPLLTTPLACQWWCAAVGSVCRSHEQCRRKFIKRSGVVDILLPRMTVAVGDQHDGLRAVGNAWATLATSPVFRELHASTATTIESWCNLAMRCNTVGTAEAAARALCLMTAGSNEPKVLFGEAPDLRASLISLGRAVTLRSGASSTDNVSQALEQYCAALSNISGASRLPAGFINQPLYETVMAVGETIASMPSSRESEACARWWCRAVQQFSTSTTVVCLVQLSTPQAFSVLSRVGNCTQEAAELPSQNNRLALLIAWCRCLRTIASDNADVLVSLPLPLITALRDTAARFALQAASPEAVAAVSEACCSLMVTPVLAGVFADASMRSATLRITEFAFTASAIRWLCTLVSLITSADAAYQELWGCEEGCERMILMARCLCEICDTLKPSEVEAPQAVLTAQSGVAAWGALLCNITSENLFVTTLLVSPRARSGECSLARAVCELALCARSAAAVQWVCSSMCNLGYFQANEDCQRVWVKEGDIAFHALCSLGEAAALLKGSNTTMLWYSRALAHVTTQPVLQRYFSSVQACEVLARVCVAASCATDEVIATLCEALNNIYCRLVANQVAVVESPMMRKALMHLLRPIETSDTLIWWLHVMIVLHSRPSGPAWFADAHGARYLLSLVKRNLVVGEATIVSMCMVIVFSLRNAAGLASTVLPDAHDHRASSPISVSSVDSAALDILEAILHHFTKDVAGSDDARGWQTRALRFVLAHRSATQPSFLPSDTESILSLPPPTAIVAAQVAARRRTTFVENVQAYASLRRQSSR